ncbi:MAG: hypothetical protein ACFNQI_06295 [Eikenella corrodens]
MKHAALILTASLLLTACQSTSTVAEHQNAVFHPLTQGENSHEEFARHCAAEHGTLGVVQAADNRNAYTLVCRSADGTLAYGYGIGRR